MAIIKAKGIRNGQPLEIYYSDGAYIFNNKRNDTIMRELSFELKLRHPFAGTYYPEENSELNVLNVLQHYFFDNRPEIETQGDFEEMPSEPGVIY